MTQQMRKKIINSQFVQFEIMEILRKMQDSNLKTCFKRFAIFIMTINLNGDGKKQGGKRM